MLHRSSGVGFDAVASERFLGLGGCIETRLAGQGLTSQGSRGSSYRVASAKSIQLGQLSQCSDGRSWNYSYWLIDHRFLTY
jgi:hypothetical protein